MNVLAKFVHGSHLYGLDRPESDLDYKAVYMPSLTDMLVGNIRHSVNLNSNKSNTKNTQDDVDYEVYSLHKWMTMLANGEMVAMDMMFAPESMVTYLNAGGTGQTEQERKFNPVWQVRHLHREKFLSKNMTAYMGYCRKQAAKYGIKGSRIAALRQILEALDQITYSADTRLQDVMDRLPEPAHTEQTPEHFEILGSKHQLTVKLSEFHERLQKQFDKYGERARQAERNEGIDWKAVSHAFRACIQLQDLFTFGVMRLPLPEEYRPYIMKIKQGQADWNQVQQQLEDLLVQVEQYAERTTLEETTDQEQIQALLVNLVRSYWEV